MSATRKESRLVQNLVLATFLVAAQWGALVHAFEHDAGTPQNRVCTTCVAASQLGLGCFDSSVTIESVPFCPIQSTSVTTSTKSFHTLVARQRGPPKPL